MDQTTKSMLIQWELALYYAERKIHLTQIGIVKIADSKSSCIVLKNQLLCGLHHVFLPFLPFQSLFLFLFISSDCCLLLLDSLFFLLHFELTFVTLQHLALLNIRWYAMHSVLCSIGIMFSEIISFSLLFDIISSFYWINQTY